MAAGSPPGGTERTADPADGPAGGCHGAAGRKPAGAQRPAFRLADSNAAGTELARRLKGQAPADFPRETAIGALALYVSNESVADFQPMNINFGIMPPLDHRVKGKRNKNAELSQRSLALIEGLNERL